VNTHAEFDALVGWHVGIALRHTALLGDGTPSRVHGAGELDQNSIAGSFNNASAVLRDHWLEKFTAVSVEPGECAFLVGTH
jgi:hypothetical protein